MFLQLEWVIFERESKILFKNKLNAQVKFRFATRQQGLATVNSLFCSKKVGFTEYWFLRRIMTNLNFITESIVRHDGYQCRWKFQYIFYWKLPLPNKIRKKWNPRMCHEQIPHNFSFSCKYRWYNFAVKIESRILEFFIFKATECSFQEMDKLEEFRLMNVPFSVFRSAFPGLFPEDWHIDTSGRINFQPPRFGTDGFKHSVFDVNIYFL